MIMLQDFFVRQILICVLNCNLYLLALLHKFAFFIHCYYYHLFFFTMTLFVISSLLICWIWKNVRQKLRHYYMPRVEGKKHFYFLTKTTYSHITTLSSSPLMLVEMAALLGESIAELVDESQGPNVASEEAIEFLRHSLPLQVTMLLYHWLYKPCFNNMNVFI